MVEGVRGVDVSFLSLSVGMKRSRTFNNCLRIGDSGMRGDI
jgi:hypothetical protein